MVALLGSGDELLHVIERYFPGADIHVRGNEITVTGPADDTALVDRLFRELTTMIARGTELSAAVVEQTVSMLRTGSRIDAPADGGRPARRLAHPAGTPGRTPANR